MNLLHLLHTALLLTLTTATIPPSSCTRLSKRCPQSASTYCSSILTTTTITPTTTSTVLLPFFSCNPANANEPRAAFATPPVPRAALPTPPALAIRAKAPRPPACFKNAITGPSDPAITEACSCINVAPSTVTASTVTASTVTASTAATETAFTGKFFLRNQNQPLYAREVQSRGTPVAKFDLPATSASAAAVYHINSACNLLDSQGLVAYAASQDGAVIGWFDPASAPGGEAELVCQVFVAEGGAEGTMDCRPAGASGGGTGRNGKGVWEVLSTDDGGDLFVRVYPEGTQGEVRG